MAAPPKLAHILLSLHSCYQFDVMISHKCLSEIQIRGIDSRLFVILLSLVSRTLTLPCNTNSLIHDKVTWKGFNCGLACTSIVAG